MKLNNILMEVNVVCTTRKYLSVPDFYENNIEVVEYILEALNFYGFNISNFNWVNNSGLYEKGLFLNWS